jgi:hypothetical protein
MKHGTPTCVSSQGRPCSPALLAKRAFGVWWLDPVVALGIAAVAVEEGRKALAEYWCPSATARTVA